MNVKLIKEKTLYAERKALIEQQLKIVHEVLCDPSAVERIENYSDVFAAGNFRNLKRIAELLSASAQENGSKRLVETMRWNYVCYKERRQQSFFPCVSVNESNPPDVLKYAQCQSYPANESIPR